MFVENAAKIASEWIFRCGHKMSALCNTDIGSILLLLGGLRGIPPAKKLKRKEKKYGM